MPRSQHSLDLIITRSRWTHDDAREVLAAFETSGLTVAAFAAMHSLDAQRVGRRAWFATMTPSGSPFATPLTSQIQRRHRAGRRRIGHQLVQRVERDAHSGKVAARGRVPDRRGERDDDTARAGRARDRHRRLQVGRCPRHRSLRSGGRTRDVCPPTRPLRPSLRDSSDRYIRLRARPRRLDIEGARRKSVTHQRHSRLSRRPSSFVVTRHWIVLIRGLKIPVS